MPASLTKSARCALLWAAAIGALLAVAGCTPMNLRGDNFRDDMTGWGETARRPAAQSDLWGFSQQARQVERNLGVK